MKIKSTPNYWTFVQTIKQLRENPNYAPNSKLQQIFNKAPTMSESKGNKQVTVDVIYCGGWGYAPKFRAIEEEIKKLGLPNVKIVGHATEEITGHLEVSVNGTLIHSKKNGMGYVNTKEKMTKILDAVVAASKQ